MNEMFSQGGKGSTGILTNKQAIARHFGVKQSEVVYFSEGVNLNGYKVIYDKEAQRAYSLPADIASGTTATSLSSDAVLVHSAGSVDLGDLAVKRNQFVTLPNDFTSGATIKVKNELLTHNNVQYRWGGVLPKTVAPDSTPENSGNISPTTWISVGSNGLLEETNVALGDALITVKQPYVGAQSTTQHSYNSRVVSVDDFGAIGDDIAIDDVAFQKAVDSGAQFILLTAGKTYRLKNGVGITKSLTLSGYGAKIHYVAPDFNYNHCIRIGGPTQSVGDVSVLGVSIYCDSSYIRGDTGFGISIFKGYNTKIEDVTLTNIASAGIWVTDSDITYINKCTVVGNDADGIHISDGCSSFFVTNCYVRGCADDSIAVVSDIAGDGRIPVGGIIANNLVTDSVNGHAFVAIGCANVIWDSNVARGCNGPGFGSYFWHVTGTPADEDWVRNCKFTNNLIESCGINAANASGATGFFIGALKDCIVESNTIQGSPGSTTYSTPANCMLIANALNVQINNNTFHNSNKYGIHTLDSNTSYAASFSEIAIVNNTFDLIADAVIRINPNADIGSIHIVNNTLISSPFSGSATSSIYIGKTRANKLTIAGNKNTYSSSLGWGYDTATCTNVDAYSNKPVVKQTWTPNVSGQGGTVTPGVSTGTYWREGATLHFEATLNITATGGAQNIIFSLPTAANGSASIFATGRENTVGGKMLNGVADSTTTLRMINYDNSGSLSGITGATSISARGLYTV